VQVTLRYVVPDQGTINAIADLERQLLTARTLNDRANIQRQIVQKQASMYTVKSEKHDIDFVPGADMKVRTLNPMAYDDKGKPRKLTKKELDELKGPDKKLPGYTADASDVRQNSVVTVYIPKAAKPKPGAPKDDKLAEKRPEAVMLVIVSEPPSSP